MRSERLRRTTRSILLAAMASAPLAPSPASAVTALSWMVPAGSAPATEFRIYKGPAPPPAAGELVHQGPAMLIGGTYSAAVQIDEIDQGVPVYVWLTAANASGESPPSNANFYPEGCDPAVDTDCDGIPNDGAPGDVPCATGQTQGCDDNCPYWPNPDQRDIGGIGTQSPPDGIGDACQCGDVSGNGRITSADAILVQRSLGSAPAPLARPDLCDVAGSAGCTSADYVILFRALLNPPLATLTQQCDPALMP